jgi:hypothetical protein
MRFLSGFRIFLEGTTVLRPPSSWERLRSKLGSAIDLQTPAHTISRDVIALAGHLRDVLSEVSVTNATWLSSDGEVLFHDTQGHDDDINGLIDAVHESHARLIEGFHVVRAVFEREQDGLELLLEATVPATYREGEPAMVLQISGRLAGLRSGEASSQLEARQAVTARLSDPAFLQGLWGAFERFLASVHHGLLQVFEGARVEEERVQLVAMMPSAPSLEALAEQGLASAARSAREQPSTAREGLDPWARYYDDPGYAWSDLVALDVLLFEGQRAAANSWLEDRVEILDVSGALVCERAWAGEHAARLLAVHQAAQHDYVTPSAQVYGLRDYPR